MSTRIKFKVLRVEWVVGALLSMVFGNQAAFALPAVSDYEAVPPLLAESATPLVMLALSNDHQLFYKAFTDYDDLDNDNEPETTYTNRIDYEGYFDSYKCYIYNSTNGYFEPRVFTATKYCDSSANNLWSGNFLNWATMTRIDEIRKVLYGGKRYNESAHSGYTLLERSMLPNDAHSFAKYYNGTDLADLTPFGDNTKTHSDVPTGLDNTQATGLTICNTTPDTDSSSNNSSTVVAPPLIRVVAGNYQLWNANERWQCLYHEEKSASNNNNSSTTGLYAASSNPSTSNKAKQRDSKTIGDYVARVKVCDSSLIGTEDCKQYPSGDHKPIGILQRFGDSGQVHFGLMTGSYKKNKSGGVLRQEVGDISGEVNVTTDGSFKTGVGGIIETINLFKIANYNYGDGTYNSTDGCSWGKTSFTEGKCTNWGNPFSEILLECYRYFAGKNYQGTFDADDGSIISGLTRDTTWGAPIDSTNLCARLNVIAFNASSNSYDYDALSGFSDLNPKASETAKTMTNKVGTGEGISGKYFVGEHDTDNNQLCTAKTVTNLGDVRGTCPDSPRLGGSYQMAGIAYHARINDIRTDLKEDQVVQTYGVTLSPAVPNVVIKVPGSEKIVKILPACRTIMNDGTEGNCGLVDFKIVENYLPTGTAGEYKGAFYANWEDTEQGGDYDMDMYGMIRYTITSTTIKIETDVMHKSTPFKMGFGFVVSGTTNDGFKAMSGINGYSDFDCSNCQHGDPARGKSFTIGASTANLLEQPLYYAAKWGGFTDVDGDGTPNLAEEWDQKNNTTGTLGPDGMPDSYFLAVNPKVLKAQLTNILVNILDRTASGTSAAVVANTGTGEGAFYQALYNPRFAAADGVDAVDWAGTLNALFIDSYGHIREDNAAPSGKLTDADHIVEIFYDPVSLKTKIQRYLISADGTKGTVVGIPQEVSDIEPIWNAREKLGEVTQYVKQRANYGSDANSGRYILTAIDSDGDGQINFDKNVDESLAFVGDIFDPSYVQPYFRYLGLKSTNAAEGPKIVNWIRGEAVAGYRNRRIDVDGNGVDEPVLLGDIIHSSPISIGRPSKFYDLSYGDDTYRRFRQTYENRRQVVYVGGNDGMIHAFNAGFYDPVATAYSKKLTTETAHDLGAELWAYVPYNVLPHLQWLTSPSYPHVYYIDGNIKHYDVNIFNDDATHPGGWGTILVVGMRFGGGEYTLDPKFDNDGDPSNDVTLRSGYVVLDVTDPESPPEVIAEITHENMGYTTAEPTLVKMRASDPTTGSYATPSLNEWFLVFGSGPAGSTDVAREKALNKAVSNKPAMLFSFNLKERALKEHSTGLASSFVGGVTTADWSNDYIDDAVYYGTVAGLAELPSGRLRRGVVSLDGDELKIPMSDVLDITTQPFSATPLTIRHRLGGLWVYSGTGRFFATEDNFTSQQQSYYGVKESLASDGSLETADIEVVDLINTSDIKVFADGSIDSKSSPGANIYLGGSATASKSFTDVVAAVDVADGWYFDFDRERSRNITKAAVSDQSLVFSEYQPSGLKCQPEGYGFLNAPNLRAGIPGEFAPLGTNPGSKNSEGSEEVVMSQSLGLGSPSAPTIHRRGDGKKVAIVQSSTGELSNTVIHAGEVQGSRESWKELDIVW